MKSITMSIVSKNRADFDVDQQQINRYMHTTANLQIHAQFDIDQGRLRLGLAYGN